MCPGFLTLTKHAKAGEPAKEKLTGKSRKGLHSSHAEMTSALSQGVISAAACTSIVPQCPVALSNNGGEDCFQSLLRWTAKAMFIKENRLF